jgi:hypothetical protein
LQAISQVLQVMPMRGNDYFRRLKRQVDRTLENNRPLATELQKAHTWLRRVAACLRYPPSSYPAEKHTSGQVAREMQDLLGQLAADARGQVVPMALYSGLQYRWAWIGHDLLHCYDIPGLPPDNLQMESLFGRLRRHQRRISGRKSTKALRNFGQCQILFAAQSQAHLLQQLRRVPLRDYQRSRKRLAQAENQRQFLHRLHRNPVKTMAHLADRYLKCQDELLCERDSASEQSTMHTD